MAFENYISHLNPNKEFTEAFTESLKEAVRRGVPGSGTLFNGESDPNIADFASFLSGMLVAIATRGKADDLLALYVNGKSFTLDTTTNILKNHKNIDDVADSVIQGLGGFMAFSGVAK